MILIIDNYDSFSYNLYQMVGALSSDAEIKIVRNDGFALDDIEKMSPSRIIISPGPGKPSDAGLCEKLIKAFAGKFSILGVCLGHQAICETFGATVSYAKTLMHGKPSDITLDASCELFAGLPHIIKGARYHSLSAVESTLPPVLKVTARSDDNEIMAVSHANFAVYGLQFHPESILTPLGDKILSNFLRA